MAQAEGIAEPILIGDHDQYQALCNDLGIDPASFRFEHQPTETATIQAALATIHAGEADCLIKGQIHTDVYMSAVLARDGGLRRGNGTRMVHVFALLLPDGQPLLLSDGAVNPRPDLKTRQQGIVCSVSLAHRLGIARPKVAVLSATESILESVPSSGEAATLVEWAKAQRLNATIDGPLALDGALVPEAAAIKGIHSDVAGKADILIVPDLVSGNILFKALVWFSGALAAGLVMGGQVPIILTSRADPPEARLAAIALAQLVNRHDDELQLP